MTEEGLPRCDRVTNVSKPRLPKILRIGIAREMTRLTMTQTFVAMHVSKRRRAVVFLMNDQDGRFFHAQSLSETVCRGARPEEPSV
jgi:hypothetical protein